MPPRFSVVIPVYNRAHSVLPTLQSVRDQAFTDFECIVVDDGSSDGEALRQVVGSLDDARFRYVQRRNGGASAARNTGVQEAAGEIVAFLDSDDRWLPDKLARDIAAGAGSRVIFSPVMVERRGRIVGHRPASAPRQGEPMAEYLSCRQGFTQTSTIALPLTLAKKVPFDETITFGLDDTDYAIQLAAVTSEIHMHQRSSVIMRDDEDSGRLSRSNDWLAAVAWLDHIRPSLTRRGYLALRGWHIARMAANAGRRGTALRFYTAALLRGALPLSLAVKALAQVLVRQSIYARFKR